MTATARISGISATALNRASAEGGYTAYTATSLAEAEALLDTPRPGAPTPRHCLPVLSWGLPEISVAGTRSCTYSVRRRCRGAFRGLQEEHTWESETWPSEAESAIWF